MHYVYFIKSTKSNFCYIGYTNDLKRRINEHNSGKVISTKFYMPFKLIYYEAYSNKKDAILREHLLKHHGSAIGHLKKRIKFSLEN
jgi:putative endonuclease